jgi:methyl-accepting chemotaxis protein
LWSRPGRPQVARARGLLTAYAAAFADLVTNQRAAETVENEVLAPQEKIISEGLQKLLVQAQAQGDTNAAFQISNGLKAYFECTSLVNGFLLTGDLKKATAASAALAVTMKQIQRMEKDQLEMEKLDATLKDDAKKALIAALQKSAEVHGQGLKEVVAGKQARDKIIVDRIQKIGPEFTEALVRVKSAVHDFQNELERTSRGEQRRNEAVVAGVTVDRARVGRGVCVVHDAGRHAGHHGGRRTIGDGVREGHGLRRASRASQFVDGGRRFATGGFARGNQFLVARDGQHDDP